MQRIAVTGGNGLLGRYVVETLQPDYEVSVVDRSDAGQRDLQPHGPVDVLDLDALGHALAGHDAVVHLAAIDAAVDAAPEAYFHTNVAAAWNVLHAGYEAGIRRFSLCSSSSAYGIRTDYRAAPHYLPMDEDHPLQASDPYGLSKRACETAAEGFAARAGMSVTVLRPCFVAFPHAVDRMFEVHAGHDTPAGGTGWVAPMPPLRWFVAPRDVARCFRAAIESDLRFEAFNVSAPDTFSHEPTLERLHALFGETPRLADPARFEEDPFASPMSIDKARRLLGWEPRETWRGWQKARE